MRSVAVGVPEIFWMCRYIVYHQSCVDDLLAFPAFAKMTAWSLYPTDEGLLMNGSPESEMGSTTESNWTLKPAAMPSRGRGRKHGSL
ncbi:hypothetical protein M408DRAFT_326743 [Serendipita vermifera MAFF 305830]|uniref:Uncharacterized protein n=1 Tax=Serendipita vermifera MAFF 305830 TaxID=933852 RepID=A0A0C2X4R4_SERVB|nr:hypothetical protein M408DRAFT_326743 [Serendipita vermifera MAFF 305830]